MEKNDRKNNLMPIENIVDLNLTQLYELSSILGQMKELNLVSFRSNY